MRSPLFVIIAACTALSTNAFSQAASPAEAIQRFSELNEEERATLHEHLASKMPPEMRMTIGPSAVAHAESVVGRQENGKLHTIHDETEKLILKTAGDYLNALAPAKVPAFAKAGELFGDIPDDAERITDASATIHPRRVRWHATGLYVPPGEVVTITVPEEWSDRGLSVVVSGHRDRIPLSKKLHRLPSSVSRSFPIESTKTLVANAFGGALYINTDAESIDADAFEITIDGAMRAPYFVLGSTSAESWRESQRDNPGAYAEFVGRNIAISFPAEWIRDLDDPTALMKYWDGVVALHDELGGMAEVRQMPERVNVDVQISAGLFHAGYPAQGPQGQCRGVVDLDALTSKGNWGWFHEMGHEAQRRPDKAWGWNNPYTFDKSVEVTVNLFSAHAFDRLGMRLRGGWSWTASADGVADKAKETLDKGETYLTTGFAGKLAMHLQVRDAFGWEPIQATLASYSNDQDERPELLPKGDEAKRAEWLRRLSEATGHNLGPFMRDLWGIPLTDADMAAVAELPEWMPEGFAKP